MVIGTGEIWSIRSRIKDKYETGESSALPSSNFRFSAALGTSSGGASRKCTDDGEGSVGGGAFSAVPE